MIPGMNILNMALGAISPQTVAYHKWSGKTTDDIGVDINTYAPAKIVRGSFQPVARNLYQNLGLDLQKTYFNFYVSKTLLDVERGVGGDQLTFDNGRYQVLSATPWDKIDGWMAVLCIQVGDVNAR